MVIINTSPKTIDDLKKVLAEQNISQNSLRINVNMG